jgi:hypothetical protein
MTTVESFMIIKELIIKIILFIVSTDLKCVSVIHIFNVFFSLREVFEKDTQWEMDMSISCPKLLNGFQ